MQIITLATRILRLSWLPTAPSGNFGTLRNPGSHMSNDCSITSSLTMSTALRSSAPSSSVLWRALRYQLIRNLLAPAKPTDKTFTQIVEAVEQHLQPWPSVIVQRFNFHSRSRRADENVSTYIAELRKLSEYCAFGDTLNDMLRDRLVCGINDQRLQRRLLAEPTLTFEKAWELAQASETAERNAKQLEKAAPATAVHALPSGYPGGGARQQMTIRRPMQPRCKCYRCGGNHFPGKCQFKDSECHYCGKKGHIAKVC